MIVIDDGRPRNAVAEFSHGFLTRDGARPSELIERARTDLTAYSGVHFARSSALEAVKDGDRFVITTVQGQAYAGKTLLLATGVFDELPDVGGLAERWGRSVFVCPFCDGWEVRDRRIAAFGPGREAVELGQELYGWSKDLIICVERDDLTDRDRRWIAAANVALKVGKLEALSGSDPETILKFADGDAVTCRALFISAPLRQHSPLFAKLGCRIGDDGLVVVDEHARTSVPGCYAAGDCVTLRHQVLIAAASGAAAAITLSCNLLESEVEAIVAPRESAPRS